MEQAYCPYCKAPYQVKNGACAHCEVVFPWEAIGERLTDEIKSREANRARATFTLVDEVFQAASGKGKLSNAAVKGFFFAWIYPRTVIVIGSILSALILTFQTWLICQQTQLIKYQSDAARVENAARLRERIGNNGLLVTQIESLHRRLAWLDEVRNACDPHHTPCTVTAAEEIQRTVSFQANDGKPGVQDLRQGTVLGLLLSARKANELLYGELSSDEASLKTASGAQAVFDKAVLQCLYPKQNLFQVKRAFQVLKIMGRPPSYWEESTYFKATVLANQMMEFSSNTNAPEHGSNQMGEVTVDEFLKAYVAWKQVLDSEVSTMKKLCSERVDLDFIELRKVEVSR